MPDAKIIPKLVPNVVIHNANLKHGISVSQCAILSSYQCIILFLHRRSSFRTAIVASFPPSRHFRSSSPRTAP